MSTPRPLPPPRYGSDPQGEHWGWTLRPPAAPAPRPFEVEPPGLPVFAAVWSVRLAERQQRGRQWASRHATRGLIAVGIAGGAWLAHSVAGGPLRLIAIAALLTSGALTCLATRPLWLPVWSNARYRRWRTEVLAQLTPAVARVRQWQKSRQEYTAATETAQAPVWEPVRPTTSQRVDVYGGTTTGLTMLLGSVIRSTAGTGTRSWFVDLGQDNVGEQVTATVSAAPAPVRVLRLPEQLSAARLLEGFAPHQAAVALSEMVAGVDGDDRDRTLDASMLERIFGCLSPPLNFTRLHAAVTLAARTAAQPEGLTPPERRAVIDLLGETVRRSAEPRLLRMAAALQQLASMEGDDDQGPRSEQQRGQHPDHWQAGLHVWQLADDLSEVGAALLTQLTMQVVLERLRTDDTPPTEPRLLIVSGAERLGRANLERVDRLARLRGIRLVLCARHLRADTVEVLGGGDSVIFLRLGNAVEAEHAANFIGREHRLVASQYSVSRATNTGTSYGGSTSYGHTTQMSRTEGTQASRATNFQSRLGVFELPHDADSGSYGHQESLTTSTGESLSDGRNWSHQTGRSITESATYQRVYEYTVTPKMIQDLSPTAFILVDPCDPAGARLGDCGIDPIGAMPTPTPSPGRVTDAWSVTTGQRSRFGGQH